MSFLPISNPTLHDFVDVKDVDFSVVTPTVSVTPSSVATCFSNVIAEHHYKLASKIQNKEQDNQMIGFLISKYEKELQKDSSNYVLNSRLGELYELLFSYEQAEKYYKKRPCVDLVGDAAEIFEQYLEEKKQESVV